ncbi:hypothetical protein HMPREF1982_03454 [Clostridiales bacterium oral taxon 876 str. F0540]|nr:hypothetical protein HMPREF1982_03454 [Clostridiales bacterium oral taxon 876 str. F0540]
MRNLEISLISLGVLAFLMYNHFSKEELDNKAYIPFVIFLIITGYITFRIGALDSGAIEGFVLRFILGGLIGILQGCLAKISVEQGEVKYKGTAVGLVFWLVFIPVRLIILPLISTVAVSNTNFGHYDLAVSALYIFTGFFLVKPYVLIKRGINLNK